MVATSKIGPLVATDWLSDHLSDPGLRVIDASWHLPTARRDARAEYAQTHIPGAVFFDIDALSDHDSGLPHMLPSAAAFGEAVGAMGIGDGDRIVVYDSLGLFSAARVWWMFRVFGCAEVAVLAGGLLKWRAEGRALTDEAPRLPPRRFSAHLDASAVADFDAVREGLSRGAIQVFDARPAARFEGLADEPRPGVRRGAIPGSRSLPASALIENGALLAPERLSAAFDAAGYDPRKPLVTSCGSGVSAAIINLACAALGRDAPALYDGSWTDWAGRTPPE